MEGSSLKDSNQSPKIKGGFIFLFVALLLLLTTLLYPAFKPEMVQFSNDGPYGVISSDVWKLPETFLGQWNDLNWLGNEDVAAPPNMTNLIRYLLGTLGFAKFNAFLATLFAGLCGGLFFRAIGGNTWVCAMGGIAAAFNMNNFSNACWGLGSRPLCFGGVMLALAMVARGFRGRFRWLKVGLVGVGAGLAIMEGYDLGAILCAYIALYTVFVTIFVEAKKGEPLSSPLSKRILLAISRVAVIAGVAALVASYSLSSLSETQVKGVGVFEDQQVEAQRWDFSTQWSFPKKETLRIIIPGLLGYRMYEEDGSGYWGSVGEAPGYQFGGGGARFSGSGEYAGLFVVLLASWAVANIWRKKENPFTENEIRHLKFWFIVGLVSLLLAFGRYAPFYQLVYITPVFGKFRNPIKYLVPFHISTLILFGYAMLGLCRAYLNRPQSSTPDRERQSSLGTILALSWRNLGSFDKSWCWGLLGWIGASVLGFLIFLSSQDTLVVWMEQTGIKTQVARLNFQASMWEIMIYIALLMLGLVMMALVLGKRLSAKESVLVCLAFLFVLSADFYRANKPWVVFYNYRERLQKDDLLTTLAASSKTERVASFPIGNEHGRALAQLYSVEWLQHEFPHYNIPTLESWMEPRKAMDKIIFESTFSTNPVRYWELTGTRKLISLAGVASALNEAWAPAQKRFSELVPFTLKQTSPPRHYLARTNQEGPFALMEFSGAIPRLALYKHWEVTPSDEITLSKLSDVMFDPAQTLLVDEQSAMDASGAGEKSILPPCTNNREPFAQLEYESYSPLKFTVNLKGVVRDSILLVNDRYSPKWKAFVDGKPAQVLRCNYIARGIYLTPGVHHVEMRFEQPVYFFFLSFLLMAVGLPIVIIQLRKSQN